MVYAIEDIARALKEAREAKSLSQRALSTKAGLTQAHISSIENAGSDVRLSNLMELARVLDLELMLVPRKIVPAVQGLVRNSGGASPGTPPPRKTIRFLERAFDKLASLHPQPKDFPELRSIVSTLRSFNLNTEQIRAVEAAAKEAKRLRDALQKIEFGGILPAAESHRLSQITNRLRAIRNAAMHSIAAQDMNRVLRAYELDDGEADG